jgi:MFS family permease
MQESGPPARTLRRNFALGVANGALFRLYGTLTDPSLVLTWFVSQLGASSLVIGMLLPIGQGGWFLPQLLVSGLARRMPRKMPLYRASALGRAFCWVMLTFLVWSTWNGNASLLLTVFLAVYAVYALLSGVGGLSFMDVVGKAIAADRRGSFFAWREFGGGVLALAGGALTSYVLREQSGLAFPRNFASLFAVATLALVGGLVTFAQVTEPAGVAGDEDSRRAGWRAIPALLWHDRNYAAFVAARILLLVHGVSRPFYTVFAVQELAAPTGVAGAYLTAFTLASVGSTILWGQLSDRRGNRTAMLVASLLSILPPLVPLGLGARLSYAAFAGQFVLVGALQSGIFISALSLGLDLAPAEDRVLYIGLLNTVLGVVSLLLLAGGFVVERWGLDAVFAPSAVCAALATLLVAAVRDPGRTAASTGGK